MMDDRRLKPREFLESCLGEEVEVTLKGGETARGRLESFDEHLNLELEDVQKPKNTPGDRRFKNLVIRGSSVVFVTPSRV